MQPLEVNSHAFSSDNSLLCAMSILDLLTGQYPCFPAFGPVIILIRRFSMQIRHSDRKKQL